MWWTLKLTQSIKANAQHQPFVYFTLSTVAVDGSPRARTVVLREFNEQKGELSMCTSTLAQKWTEIERDTRFEICFYFVETREQWRMRGDCVRRAKGRENAEEVWNQLSVNQREVFERETQSNGNVSTFGVLWFTPNLYVEHLDLFTGEVTKS